MALLLSGGFPWVYDFLFPHALRSQSEGPPCTPPAPRVAPSCQERGLVGSSHPGFPSDGLCSLRRQPCWALCAPLPGAGAWQLPPHMEPRKTLNN